MKLLKNRADGFKYLFVFSLLLVSVACSPNQETKPNLESNSGNKDKSSQPLHIEKALMTRPHLVQMHKSDNVVMNQLAKYLDAAPPGAVVHISVYLFDYKKILNALTRAYHKGVEVHLLIDSSKVSSRSTNKKAYDLFGPMFKAPSEMIGINNGNTAGAINHDKYALFSEVDLKDGIAKHLVFSTSHNFIPSATKKVNDAIIMTNKELYHAFLDNWEEAAAHADLDMKNFTYKRVNVGDSITAFFFPWRKNGQWTGEDPIINQLDSLDKDSYSKDTVDIFMAFWTRIGVAHKLLQLQQQGVMVQVITREDGGQGVSSDVMSILHQIKNAGGYVKILDITKENDHSKCMLIKGIWKGSPQKIILSGSENYTVSALKYNNNQLLRLKNSKLFKNYWSYFKALQTTLDDFSGWGD